MTAGLRKSGANSSGSKSSRPGGAALAVAAARNYRRLRAAGWTIRRTVDCLIATFCLMEDHELLHNDRDFDPFERALGLRVIHP